MTRITRTYSEMALLETFEERFEYLNLAGVVGEKTFGFDRYYNQKFYTSREWKDVRHHVIARDLGCDLGVEGFEVHEKPLIHHIVPMTLDDLRNANDLILDPDNLITTTHRTHNAIHYGDKSQLLMPSVGRSAGDTKLW